MIAPPDGDMKAYMASLARLVDREETLYYPAHGEPVEKARRHARGLIDHRKQREGQILRAIDEGQRSLLRQAPTAMRLARASARQAVESNFQLPLRAAGIAAVVRAQFRNEANPDRMDRSRNVPDGMRRNGE